jgi:hypothetical protein
VCLSDSEAAQVAARAAGRRGGLVGGVQAGPVRGGCGDAAQLGGAHQPPTRPQILAQPHALAKTAFRTTLRIANGTIPK